MQTMSLALAIYALAILIALLVALVSKGIGAATDWFHKTPPSPPAASAAADELAHEDIAVIAAAVYAMLGVQRIVHIEDVHRGQVWTASARASQYASRKPPRRPRH
jgi:ABC-type phosphate transport system permease subunit